MGLRVTFWKGETRVWGGGGSMGLLPVSILMWVLHGNAGRVTGGRKSACREGGLSRAGSIKTRALGSPFCPISLG